MQSRLSAIEVKQRRTLIFWICVWAPIVVFWLLSAIVSGAVLFAAFVLAPVVLTRLSFTRGTEALRAPVVYVLGAAPALTFPVITWKWPIGILIIVMIFAYEKVLETILDLRVTQRLSADPDLALTRIRRISLVMISVDAYAAGVFALWLVLAIVAIVRLGRVTVALTVVGLLISAAAFVATGHPDQFIGIGLSIGVDPSDVDTWFAIETLFVGALPLWVRTLYNVWR